MKSFLSLLLTALISGNAFSAIGTSIDRTWGDTDAHLGVSGFTIVNFESTSLPADLSINFVNGFDGVSGNWNTGLGGTLPFIVAPANDTAGTAFQLGAWDGTHFMANVPRIPITSYASSFGWADLTLTFRTGATAVGFSLQQANLNDTFLVNGS